MSRNKVFDKSYNERLFGSGVAKLVHESRYHALAKLFDQKRSEKVLELGCFDGKTLEYFSHSPKLYEGYDANWEGGLELAKSKWSECPNYHFFESSSVESFITKEKEFDFGICMETLEHLPDEDVPLYIEKLSIGVSGTIFITVPNEIGIFFLIKFIYKSVFGKVTERYTVKEIWRTLFGNVEAVERNTGGHKGFSHRKLINHLKSHMKIKEVYGLPFKYLPKSLNPTIVIHASSV